MKQFLIGCLVGASVVGAGAILLIKKIEDRPVMFASKQYFKINDKVIFEGSIYGVGDETEKPVNNYIRGVCSKSSMSCEIATMDEVAKGHVGALWIETIPIRSWEKNRIVADSKGLSSIDEQCNWYRISINPKTERIDYTRYPNEQARAQCAKFSSERIHRWRIDNGPAWLEDADGTKRY